MYKKILAQVVIGILDLWNASTYLSIFHKFYPKSSNSTYRPHRPIVCKIRQYYIAFFIFFPGRTQPPCFQHVDAIFKISKFLNHHISLILHLVSITFIYIIIRTNGPRANVNQSCLTFSLSNNLLVLDSSIDRRTYRIKHNLGNQSVSD